MKTSVVEQVAQERGMTYIKLNLAQLEEAGDLIGFPVKEYEVKSKEGKIQWISADLLKYYLELGYEATGEQQMGYATPKWLPKDDNPNGVILCLDDYSRANSILTQSTMELIDRQEYISWHLPKYTNIVLK